MNASADWRKSLGMTLIEVMIVMGIIGILAAILVPSLHRVSVRAKVTTARSQMQILMGAINAYDTAYSNLPVSPVVTDSSKASQPDFTFGTYGTASPWHIENSPTSLVDYEANNSELTAALLDLTQFADGKPTVNANHALNPRHVLFLNAKSGDAGAMGADGVFRDPWGNPYIITVDLNRDGYCRDALYRLDSVSKISGGSGYDGLTSNGGTPNAFEANTSVMMWSLGPDGYADANLKANQNDAVTGKGNADNILSWK